MVRFIRSGLKSGDLPSDKPTQCEEQPSGQAVTDLVDPGAVGVAVGNYSVVVEYFGGEGG
jgi:hypothetical protein